MRLLLDTHIFLWLNSEPAKLSVKALEACSNPDNHLYLSLISLWEIQIKAQLGKLHLQSSWQKMLEVQRVENGLQTLPLSENHIKQLGQLPSHHKDPFDRLLIAQAQTEEMLLVSADGVFTAYDVDLIW
ncbi:MAG: type II toxin-antitoxin system VapC family toxin [Gammaproteobacteria bacterium]|nr:type II toxin-antitoxin system VapC family toxin [Gammaproteobacteria bacterium]